MAPIGSMMGFNNVDPQGNPTANIVNQLVNFGWEYVYHCHILSHEEMDMMRPVSVALPPIAANGLGFVDNLDGTATLSWNDNSINETEFLLQKSGDNVTWTDVGSSPSPLDTPNTHGVRNLTDPAYDWNADYLYRVVAKNTVGYGAEFPSLTVQSVSAPIIVTGVPADPTNLTAVYQPDQQVLLTWSDNSYNEAGFVVERSTDGVNFTQIQSLGPNSTSFTDVPVALETTYSYRVYAFNYAGNSGYSNVASVTTPPLAPTNLTAVYQSGPQILLNWVDNANTETNYVVERSDNGGAFTAIATLGPNTITYSDVSVALDTNYAYRVTATNAFGRSPYSNAVLITTPPSAPTNLTAVYSSVPQVLLNWTDNASTETGYVVVRSVNGGPFTSLATLGANSTSYIDLDVALPDTIYSYQVYAFNATGNSAYSNVATITTPPVAPTGLTAVYQPGPQVLLNWTDNANTETGFVVERSANGGPFASLTTLAANVSTFTDTTVAFDTNYAYRVYAFNANGNSPFSNVATVTTPPTAPTNLTAVYSAVPQVALSWTDNSSIETGYVVERSVNGGAFTGIATLGANVTTFTDLDVAQLDTTFTYRVYAYNATGNSANSNEVSISTPPLTPTGLAAVYQAGPQICLTWTDNATKETGYSVERSTNNVNFSWIATLGANSIAYVDASVAFDTVYYYRVYAFNLSGNSGFSNVATMTTPPVAPSNVTCDSFPAGRQGSGYSYLVG